MVHAEAPETFEARLSALLPHLGLIVSGGNTLLFTLDAARRITVLSSTRDDAAGEALDKGAKLLGLGYPGGPLVERLAPRHDYVVAGGAVADGVEDTITADDEGRALVSVDLDDRREVFLRPAAS